MSRRVWQTTGQTAAGVPYRGMRILLSRLALSALTDCIALRRRSDKPAALSECRQTPPITRQSCLGSRECAVNCDHLQTISRGKLGAVLTTLSVSKMEEVAAATRFALDLG